jgi:hypothetical protein
MKRTILVILALISAFATYQWAYSEDPSDTAPPAAVHCPDAAMADSQGTAGGNNGYVVIGWNSLGMHCMNSRFQYMCVLPPYNTLMVQVIQRGNPPKVVTNGLKIEYAVDGNTYSVRKTDFWTYANSLFGVTLKPNIGLAGYGLTGTMAATRPLSTPSDPNAQEDHFEAVGIPVTPYNDRMTWYPYQTATVKVKNLGGRQVASTSVVLPVSDEIHCDMCHQQYGDAGGFDSPIVEINILRAHDAMSQTQLEQQAVTQGKPVLCASCHADAALGMTGTPGVKSLSEAMHNWHGNLDDKPSCFACHPGPKTRCNRSAISGMGRDNSTDPGCEKCHGTIANVAQTVTDGRRPWQDEPTCAGCHGPNYTTGVDLYRNATGPCGLYCATCHNSPHAWYPSRLNTDDKQPLQLQGTPFSIGNNCTACHTKAKIGDNPHVMYNFQWP